MVGSEYYLFSDYLKPMNLKFKAFVEWQSNHIKNFTNGNKSSRVRDNVTLIGNFPMFLLEMMLTELAEV